MPFKHNAARRHRIPKARYRVTNWPAYEAGLRQRGNVTFWLDAAAMAGWPAARRTTPGGQPRYSDVAVELVLTLRLVFHLALRRAEAFARSVVHRLGLELAVPDHTHYPGAVAASPVGSPVPAGMPVPSTSCSTAPACSCSAKREWDAEKHGRARRQWRKLHLAVDVGTGEIAAHVLTDCNTDDAAQAPTLLRQVEGSIASVTADGAYDGELVYHAAAARQHDPPPDVVIPPRASAVPSTDTLDAQSPCDRHIRIMAQKGRIGWQHATGYGRGNHVETTIARYKHLIGPKLRARSLSAQQGEAAIAVSVLNRMIRVAKPVSVRRA